MMKKNPGNFKGEFMKYLFILLVCMTGCSTTTINRKICTNLDGSTFYCSSNDSSAYDFEPHGPRKF
jgi:hypothetical protein